MRPKTAGGQFGIKTGSSLSINPQTGPNLGPGSYALCRGGSSKNVKKNIGFGTDYSSRGVGGGKAGKAPGPGMYNVTGSLEIENGHIFGTSTRKADRDLMNAPGPGQYNLCGSISKETGVSIKAKTSYGGFIQTRDTPGPGQYSTDKRTGHQGSKIGTSNRIDFTGNGGETPGPGTHNATDFDIRSR